MAIFTTIVCSLAAALTAFLAGNIIVVANDIANASGYTDREFLWYCAAAAALSALAVGLVVVAVV